MHIGKPLAAALASPVALSAQGVTPETFNASISNALNPAGGFQPLSPGHLLGQPSPFLTRYGDDIWSGQSSTGGAAENRPQPIQFPLPAQDAWRYDLQESFLKAFNALIEEGWKLPASPDMHFTAKFGVNLQLNVINQFIKDNVDRVEGTSVSSDKDLGSGLLLTLLEGSLWCYRVVEGEVGLGEITSLFKNYAKPYNEVIAAKNHMTSIIKSWDESNGPHELLLPKEVTQTLENKLRELNQNRPTITRNDFMSAIAPELGVFLAWMVASLRGRQGNPTAV